MPLPQAGFNNTEKLVYAKLRGREKAKPYIWQNRKRVIDGECLRFDRFNCLGRFRSLRGVG